MNDYKNLIISGMLFTLVLFLWPVFMGIAQPQGTEIEQLQWISKNISIYKVQFFFAFLIGPSIIYLMISQHEKFQPASEIAKVGLVSLAAYFVLNSISYASQIVLVPRLLEGGFLEQANIWYFNSSTSIAYFFNQMGYFFWGVGALILFGGLIKRKGIIKYISIIYTISAILSLLAFIGLVINSTALNFLTLPSGLVLIPVGIMTIIWGVRERKNQISD